MPYTLKDFDEYFVREHLPKLISRLSPNERLAGLSSDERLKGLSLDDVLQGLSEEQIAELKQRLQSGDDASRN